MGPAVKDKVAFSDSGNPLNIYGPEPATEEGAVQKARPLFSAKFVSAFLLAAMLLRYFFQREQDDAQKHDADGATAGQKSYEPPPPEFSFQVIDGGLQEAGFRSLNHGLQFEGSPLPKSWGTVGTSALNRFIDFGIPEEPLAPSQKGTHLSPGPSNDNSPLYGASPGRAIQHSADQILPSGGGSGGSGQSNSAASSESQSGDSSTSSGPAGSANDTGGNASNEVQAGGNSGDGATNHRPGVTRTVALRSIGMNESVLISLAALLQYASDPDGDELSVTQLHASSGEIEFVGEGQWRFTPEYGDTSEVIFDYSITDGALSISQVAWLDILETSRIVGTDESETIIGTSRGDVIVALAGDDIVLAREGDDVVEAGEGNDRVVAGDGDDVIYGSSGSDIIFAGGGDDTVFAGADDDLVFGEDGNDVIFGDDGNDELHGGGGNDRILGGVGNDIINGNAGADYLLGEEGNDRISGGEDDDIIIGSDGDDEMYGDEGNDTFVATAHDGDDHYDGGEGSDVYDASAAKMSVTIDLYNKTAFGDEIGNDTIILIEEAIGGSGNDVLVAGEGTSLLQGGGGDDYFVFMADLTSKGRDARDKILDYEVGDKIDIRDVSREAGEILDDSGWRKFVLISQGAEFDAPGQIRFSYETFEGVQATILQGNINDDTDIDFEIELAGYFVIDNSYFGRSSYADGFGSSGSSA